MTLDDRDVLRVCIGNSGEEPRLAGSNGFTPGVDRLWHLLGTLAILFCSLASLVGQVTVSGTVRDRNDRPVAGAKVALKHQDEPGAGGTDNSDERGAFSIRLDRDGSYALNVTCADFFPIEGKPVDLAKGFNIVQIVLVRSEDEGTSVDIHANAQIEAKEIAMSQALNEEEIDSVPMPRATKQRIQGVAAILPGVIRDPIGELHFHGSSAEETNWTLDGFNVSDPASGRLEMALGAESVQSMDLFAGRYSAALGRGTGGAMVVSTRTGGAEFKQKFTNFVPGIEFNEGLRVRDWRPRHAVSGPILKNRAWFFNSLDALYDEIFIQELPRGQNRRFSWSINDSLRLQAKLTPRQTLSAGLVADYLHAPNSGLSPLDPLETTLDRRARRFFFNLKDQFVLSPESVLDFGYAGYRSNYRGVPQGTAPFEITSFGRAGNYPVATHLVTGRDEVRANLVASRNWHGQHQISAGLNISHARYFQDIRRSPIKYFRLDGTQSSELAFAGSGAFGASNIETGTYLQDRWAIHSRLVAELGLRWDRDRIVAHGAVTPRFSLAYVPPGLDGAKLSAGVGWVPATTYLRAFTRHRDQLSISTTFAPDGMTPLGPPDIRIFKLDSTLLTIPSTRSLSAGWRQVLPAETIASVNYLRKRMRNGFAQVPVAAGPLQEDRLPASSHAVFFQLQNFKQVNYDSVELSLSRPLAGSHRWFASYTYSRSWSNAALEVETYNPILFSETAGRLSWDIPHRVVSWASFRLGARTSIVYFAEWRDGFPFSAHDDNGKQVGQVNGWRLPRHFGLNIHLERELSFLGHRWSLRPGVDNVTNRPNYRFANSNVDSPEFLRFFGRSPIKLVVRVRWLGRADN